MRTKKTIPNKIIQNIIKEAFEKQFHLKSYCEKCCDIINKEKNIIKILKK